MRVRIRFGKQKTIRFCSHKDVVRAFQRGFAAAGLPVEYSRGYHPHMRMSFGPPLKTGWGGLDEYVDLQLENAVDGFEPRCNAVLPDGLEILKSRSLADGTPKLAADICAATYTVRIGKEDAARTQAQMERVLERTEKFKVSIAGANNEPEGENPKVTSVGVDESGPDIRIEYTSSMLDGRVVAPDDVVRVIAGDPDGFETPIRVTRKRQFVLRGGSLVSPIGSEVTQGQL